MKDGIYDEFIDRLRSESDIVSILSDYVPLKKKGKNYWGCCPFHHENTPSFSVTPDKGFFYCFGCQSGGNVFNFLMKIENISFFDAVKMLAQKMNILLP
ncbi:MAG: primase, partial [Pelosinus sp.]|nr:primase [Pelosinus sp.]